MNYLRIGRRHLLKDAGLGISVACWFLQGKIRKRELHVAYAYHKLKHLAWRSMDISGRLSCSLSMTQGRGTVAFEDVQAERAWRFITAALEAGNRTRKVHEVLENELMERMHTPGHTVNLDQGQQVLQRLVVCWQDLERSAYALRWLPKRM